MGAKAGLSQKTIEVYLRAIGRHLAALEDAERRWRDETMPVEEREREQIGDRAEWHNVVDMFELLAEAHAGGALDRAASTRFLELAAGLSQARAQIDRMELRAPPEDLLHRPPAAREGAERRRRG